MWTNNEIQATWINTVELVKADEYSLLKAHLADEDNHWTS